VIIVYSTAKAGFPPAVPAKVPPTVPAKAPPAVPTRNTPKAAPQEVIKKGPPKVPPRENKPSSDSSTADDEYSPSPDVIPAKPAPPVG
jgi:hypothetical protein